MDKYKYGTYFATVTQKVDGVDQDVRKKIIIGDDTKDADVEAFLKIADKGTAKRIKDGNSEGAIILRAKLKKEAALRADKVEEAKEEPKKSK